MRKPVFGVSGYSHRRRLEASNFVYIYKVEGLYYLCSENKGADQLRGHREADLRLCFRICKKPVFSQRGSNVVLTEIVPQKLIVLLYVLFGNFSWVVFLIQ